MEATLVLVTGASSGIGEATARRYGASGARVLLLARNAERLDDVADAIRKKGGAASPYPVDLADSGAIEEVSARIASEVGTPDILINNAGAGRWLPLIDLPSAYICCSPRSQYQGNGRRPSAAALHEVFLVCY
jgi:NADP-dependent 3-hydroxy acid dehydrogenase YdfG